MPSDSFSGSIAQMQLLTFLLPYAQVILGVLLGAGILLQQRGAGLGGAFGGGDGYGFSTRRGLEKVMFQATVVIAVLFVLSTLLSLIIK